MLKHIYDRSSFVNLSLHISSRWKGDEKIRKLHKIYPLTASSSNLGAMLAVLNDYGEMKTHMDLQVYALTSHPFYLPLGPVVTLKLPILKLSGCVREEEGGGGG